MDNLEPPLKPIVEQTPNQVLMQIAVKFYGVLCLIALLWIYVREGCIPLRYILGQRPIFWQVSLGTLCAVAFIIVSLLARELFHRVREAEYDLKTLLGHLTRKQICLLAFCSSIGEELFFRGALQPSGGLLLASVLFGLVHLPPTENLFFYPVVAVIMGLLLGWMFEVSGEGLLGPTVAHFVINVVGLYRLCRLPARSETISAE